MALSDLNIRVILNDKQFNSGLKRVQKKMARFGKQMDRVGKNMSRNLTLPIAALGAGSVMAFDQQAKAIAQVEAGIRSTGNAAGYTSEQLQKMASDLQKNTLFGDEEILQNATAQLLTFTNITKDEFARTQKVVLDVSTRIGQDLTSTSIMLGKALNDPVANLGALGRAGIQFSQEQKDLIKSLWATGHQAEAQKMILTELENQYGGSAEAAAQAGTGGLKQLQNSLSDLGEEFGKIIYEYLTPLIEKIQNGVSKFKSFDDRTKKIIVTIAGIAAAIGPVLIIIGKMATGVSALIGLFSKLNLALLTNPYVLVAAAVAALGIAIYKTIKKQKELNTTTEEYAKAKTEAFKSDTASKLTTESAKLDILFKATIKSNKGTQRRKELIDEINNKYGSYLPNLLNENSTIEEIKKAQNLANKSLMNNIILKSKREALEKVYSEELNKQREILSNQLAGKQTEQQVKIFKVAANELAKYKKGTEDYLKTLEQYRTVVVSMGGSGGALENMAQSIRSQNLQIEEINNSFDGLTESMDSTTESSKNLKNQLKEDANEVGEAWKSVGVQVKIKPEIFIEDIFSKDIFAKKFSKKGLGTIETGINADFDFEDEEFEIIPEADVDKAVNNYKKGLEQTKQASAQWAQSISDIVANAMTGAFTAIGEGIGNLMSGEKVNIGDTLLMSLADFAGQFGKMLIGLGISMESLQKALAAGPFGGPIALAAGIALIAASTAIKNHLAKGSEAFANGGFASGGLAMVGERGPELVNLPSGSKVNTATRSKMMQQGGELTTRISGRDLEIILNRATAQSNRR